MTDSFCVADVLSETVWLANETVDIFDLGVEVVTVESFEEAMVLSKDAGFVLRLSDGSEFQISIVQTRSAKSGA